MTLATVKRLAADIFSVGRNKVRISPEGIKEAEGALTRSDVRSLIEKGIITKRKPEGRASTGRLTRRGRGRRKGTPVDSKRAWMEKVRAQRRFLFMLLESGALKMEQKRALYQKVKSGIFRNKRAMFLYLKDNGLVAADLEMPKAAFEKPEPKAAKPKPAKAEGQKASGAQKSQKKPEAGAGGKPKKEGEDR